MALINLYSYRARWYSTVDDIEKLSEGYVFGQSLPDAMTELGKMYGLNLIDEVNIKLIEDTDCYVYETKELNDPSDNY